MSILDSLVHGNDDAPGGDPAAVIGRHLQNAAAIVAAAGRTGVPLPVAAALAERETGGRNVFGNDVGGVFSTPDGDDAEVTEDKVRELRERVAKGETSNGIGPAQITWPPLFERADKEGLKLWEPEDNLTLGLTVLKEHAKGDFSPAGLERAGTLYNAGSLSKGVTDYGRGLAKAVAVWEERLGAVPVERTAAVEPETAGAGATHTVVDGDTLWSIAEKNGTDVDTLRRLNPEIVPEKMLVVTVVRLP